jgi:hypothetical protein
MLFDGDSHALPPLKSNVPALAAIKTWSPKFEATVFP